MPSPASCPCCSDKNFTQCCGPFLRGDSAPRTVKQLMRSRYTAYALGGYGDYLLATWHPDTAPKLNAATLSHRQLDWQNLRVLGYSQQGDTGTVEFEARFLAPDGATGVHHEVSRFVRIGGMWLYLDGQVS